jgi:glycerol kinase
MNKFILALDQGTTSSRAILFNHAGESVATAQQEFEQILPKPGHVEHDPEAIWESQLATARGAIEQAAIESEQIAAIGISNQRETTILWERESGKPIGNAIVWQSRVSEPICRRLRAAGHADMIQQKTGLVIDPYFSGSKIRHILDQHEGLQQRAERGEILFGTVDSYLVWRLTGGKLHITDATNASRTMLLNIHTVRWDDELLAMLNIPRAMLPEVRSCSEVYGETEPKWFGRPLPIAGMAGDQQAATFGQACFEEGSAKNTYGTGCFMLLNTGKKAVTSQNKLVTTIGWQLGGEVTYCLEGSVFVAGAVVQWLRDKLGVIETSAAVEQLANSVPDNDGVVVVPAFVGLGAPHWDASARGGIFGLTRGSTAAHIARAAVESMAFQTRDLAQAMQRDSGVPFGQLKVDGGACVNDELMQFQSDLLDCPVSRPTVQETTALGAAYLAGLAVGYWDDLADLASHWKLDQQFTPNMSNEVRDRHCHRWDKAVQRCLDWEEDE